MSKAYDGYTGLLANRHPPAPNHEARSPSPTQVVMNCTYMTAGTTRVKSDQEHADAALVPAVTDSQASPSAAASAAVHDPSLVTGPVEELVRAGVEMVFLVDPGHRIVYASQNVQPLLGHDPLQIVGQPMSGLVHPAHAAAFDGALTRALDGARLGEAELRWPHHGGKSSLSLLVGFAPLGPDPGTDSNRPSLTEGTMVTVRHGASAELVAAALAEDDERVRDIGSASPLVVFLLDGKGRCTWISDMWVKLTGQTQDNAAGLGWVNTIEENDRSPFRTAAAQAHRRRSGWRQQFRLRDLDGALRWVDAAAAPRFDTDGAISGYFGAMTDISADVRARTELNKRTTIVESTAEFVVMEQRGPRLVYSDDTTALIDTPPVPAASQTEATRPAMGALPGESQAQYLNEIRPTVLADGVWQARIAPLRQPPPDAAPPVEIAADVEVEIEIEAAVPDASSVALRPALAAVPFPSPSGEVVELRDSDEPAPLTFGAAAPRTAKAKLSPAGQPIAWNFDAVETGDGPVADWKNPGWAQPTIAARATAVSDDATPTASNSSVDSSVDAEPMEQVYVGLMGPSGSVESIAAVSNGVLEPTEFERVSDQLPAVDPITGLANRALFQERIRLGMKRMASDGVAVAVMLANLHGYEELRSQVGAKTGDDQLFVVSKRLEATIRQVDTAARIGESDFAILGVGWFFPGDVEAVAKRFILRIQEPVPSVGRQVTIPCSMGIAMALLDEPIAMILRRAQRARKMAAELGPGRVYVDHGDDRPPTTD